MKHSHSNLSNKPNNLAKVIPLKVQSKNAPLEYLLLSFEEINKNIEEHLQKQDNSNCKMYE